MSGPLVVVGDALLDRDVEGTVERLCPDAPVPVFEERHTVSRPGGAGLAAALAARDGCAVVLVTALSDDAAGQELAGLLEDEGIEVVDLGLEGPTPEKVRFRDFRQSLLRLDRGTSRARPGALSAAARAAIEWASAVLVSDYGRGLAADPDLRAVLSELAGRVPVIWDPHPRGPAPPAGVAVATPNRAEAAAAAGLEDVPRCAAALRKSWGAGAVCVTIGPGGAVLTTGDGAQHALAAPFVAEGDPCGAGDRFASRLAEALARGLEIEQAVGEAVHVASEFVAAGGAGSAFDALERSGPRAGTPTVVATGGCFDLLHAGHVTTLEAARALGDRLVVCLNSDRSVRRLKGPHRPVVPEADRAAVLLGLRCVDSVEIFDEDTPEQVLRRIRPQIWAKGADYAGRTLPEESALSEWGGRLVLLPYVEGRSTTRLIEEAMSRA